MRQPTHAIANLEKVLPSLSEGEHRLVGKVDSGTCTREKPDDLQKLIDARKFLLLHPFILKVVSNMPIKFG